jgi:putative acetyltransferase
MSPHPDLTFAAESPDDAPAIHELNARAFERSDEAQLVDSLRQNGGLVFSAVGRLRNVIVAHLAYSEITIGGAASSPPFLALAPVAVAPDHQKQGFGTALMRWSLDVLRDRGFPGVLVLGEPEFYGRAGFRPADEWDITCPYDVPARYFMAIETRSGGLAGARGVVAYRTEFAALT